MTCRRDEGAVSSSESLGGERGGPFSSEADFNSYLLLSGLRILRRLIDGEKGGEKVELVLYLRLVEGVERL